MYQIKFVYCVIFKHKQKMVKKKKHTLLLGEGTNQHTLYGDFAIGDETEFATLLVEKDSLLKHEKPNGSFSDEHQALSIDKGDWVMGKQVEYNPFSQTVSQVWD